jgi:hypothetical protein
MEIPMIRKSFLCAILLSIATSCYRMPEEDEVSVIPITNNPSITHERAASPIPQISY